MADSSLPPIPPGFRPREPQPTQQSGFNAANIPPPPPGFVPRKPSPAAGPDLQYLQASPQAHATPPYTGPVLSSDKPWTERAGDFAKGVYQAAKGEYEFDLPEIGPMITDMLREPVRNNLGPDSDRLFRLNEKLTLARTDKGKMDIIREDFPEARFYQDKYGGWIGSFGDITGYVNRSGISRQDVQDLTVEGGLMALGATPLGRAGGAALGGVGRVVGTGIGVGGASMLQDQLARNFGSTEPIDLQRALIAAGGGMAGETLGAVLGPVAWRTVRSVFGNGALYREGTGLTATGRSVLQQAGIDPDTITTQMGAELQRLSRTTGDLPAAARQAQAQGLPAPVTLTTGQATRSPSLLAFESEAKKGAFGDQASSTLLGQQAEQQAALRANIPALQGQVSGGSPLVGRPGEGAAGVQQSLLKQRDTAKAGVDAAYDAARAAPPAWYDARAVSRMANDVEAAVSSFPVDELPALSGRLEALRRLSMPDGSSGAQAVSLDALERWRTHTTQLASGTANRTEATAMRRMVKTYDDVMESQFKSALLAGDEKALSLWSAARQKRAQFGRVFEQDDAVNTLTAKMNDGSRRLVVGADEAVNYIFGRGRIGARDGLARDLRKLKDTLGENSTEWNMIREEAILRITGDPGTGVFPAEKFARTLDRALTEGRDAMGVLFSQNEIGMLGQLRGVALNANTTPAITANVNRSGTAVAQNIINQFGPMGRAAQIAATRLLKPFLQVGREMGAGSAARGVLPPARPTGGVGLPGAGAAAVAPRDPFLQRLEEKLLGQDK